MHDLIDDEIVNDILKPDIIPFRSHRVRKVWNFALAGGAGCIILGLILRNQNIVRIALLFSVFLIFPLLFGLYQHFVLSVIVYNKRLVIKDCSFNPFLKAGRRQEIFFEEIDYIYYLGKEYSLLKNYRHKLRKYKIPGKEMDYRKEKLINKYAVPNDVIDTFEDSSQKALNDYTATGVLIALDKILDKYKSPKNEKHKIIKDLKKTDDFNFEHLKRLLSAYNVSSDDLDNLKDEFSECDVNIATPFLLTKLKVAKAERREDGRGGLGVAVSINTTLVFSNADGTRKAYLKHFHSLSRTNWQKMIRTINENKHGIKYLMTNENYRNISDPNFKPINAQDR